MAQKQLNEEEKTLFNASLVKLNSHFNFLASFGRQAFFTDKKKVIVF